MKTKLKKMAAAVATLGMASFFPVAVLADSGSDHELPDEDDLFWRVTSSMSRPNDTAACLAAIDAISTAELVAYADAHEGEGPQSDEQQGDPSQMTEEQQASQIRDQFDQICTMIAQMPAEMQTGMASDGVTSNLFSASDWHHVSGLYFEKTGEGRISFTNTLDFLSYKFFRFMNNFDDMVEMNDGYISLNASMMDDIKTYGAQLTMYGLNLGSQQPDIYVDGQLAGSGDVSDITYDANAGSLTFTAKHFSSYRAVAHGSSVKAMKISKLNKKSVKYNARKTSFRIKVKGKNLKPASGQTIGCNLGFESASKVSYNKSGKTVYCVFPMSYFANLGTFPLTISISGKGEVTKANAFRVR